MPIFRRDRETLTGLRSYGAGGSDFRCCSPRACRAR